MGLGMRLLDGWPAEPRILRVQELPETEAIRADMTSNLHVLHKMQWLEQFEWRTWDWRAMGFMLLLLYFTTGV